MTVIVTGATGFIGRHLVDVLAAEGETDIRCLTRGRTEPDSRASVSLHRADYARPDLGLSDEALRGASVVYHVAGATQAVSARAFQAANVRATEHLLGRLEALGENPRFVYVSSQAAAGPAPDADRPKRESDVPAPIEDYGRSKLDAERAVQASKLPATIVRPVAVYGPWDRGFLAIFSLAKHGLLIYPGTKRSSVNTIFVADLVRGIVAAARSPSSVGKTYFLGDDTPRAWTELYAMIAEAVGQRPIEISVPRGVIMAAGAVGDVVGSIIQSSSLINRSKATLATPKYWLCSSEAARRDFGFVTPTSLRDGIRVTYDWYLQRRWL
jgi:nucleoside-diphosphate-sugar epimerase